MLDLPSTITTFYPMMNTIPTDVAIVSVTKGIHEELIA